MTIPFFRDGFALPVTQALLTLLNQEVANIGLNLERLTQLTFNFRSPTYSPEQGGAHPVEIRLIRGLDGWLFDYVTDFSYQGLGQDAELCKELDFNFLDDETLSARVGTTAQRGSSRTVRDVAEQFH